MPDSAAPPILTPSPAARAGMEGFWRKKAAELAGLAEDTVRRLLGSGSVPFQIHTNVQGVGHRILTSGTRVLQRYDLDFAAPLTAVDDPVNKKTVISGGGSLPRCAAYLSSLVAFNPPSGPLTAVPLDYDAFDPGNWHDAASHSPTVVLPATGDYLILAAFRPAILTTIGTVPLQLFLYGGATGTTPLDRDEYTYHQDDEHHSDSAPPLRLVYADHLAAGDQLSLRFRHVSDGAGVSCYSENGLGPRLIVQQLG